MIYFQRPEASTELVTFDRPGLDAVTREPGGHVTLAQPALIAAEARIGMLS